MKHGTDITWTHWPDTRGETWTVLRGCQWAHYRGLDGLNHGYKTCAFCYAQSTAASLTTRFDMPAYNGLTTRMPDGTAIWNGVINFDEELLYWPLHCTKPRTFFLSSMSDLWFHGVTDMKIAKIIAVMEVCLDHRFLVLTKRPDRQTALLNDPEFVKMIRECTKDMAPRERTIIEARRDSTSISKKKRFRDGMMPATNIWWGTSIEDQRSAAWALDHLSQLRTIGRLFCSYEPVIGHVDFRQLEIEPGLFLDALTGDLSGQLDGPYLQKHSKLPAIREPLSWVISGGASPQRGRNPFKFDLDYARSLDKQLKEARCPHFRKQLGGKLIKGDTRVFLDVHTGHNADPQYWPEDLRVQEFPKE